MTDKQSPSKNVKRGLIGYPLLHIYISIIMFVLSYQIHIGPRATEPVGYIMTGITVGAGLIMFGTGLINLFQGISYSSNTMYKRKKQKEN